MPGRGNAKGHGGPMGHGGGHEREGQDGEIGQHRDATPESTDQGEQGHGRSESSPGHVKQAAGAQSARDYAPGRTGRTGDATGTPSPETGLDDEAED